MLPTCVCFHIINIFRGIVLHWLLILLKLVVFGKCDNSVIIHVGNFQVLVLPSQLHSVNGLLSAEDAAVDYEFVIRQLVRTCLIGVSETSDCPKFDLVLLDMGSDGHVASLFPGHFDPDETEEWVTYITDSPEPPSGRITFTMPVINAAANVAVIATGSDKAEAAHLVIDDAGPECPLPAKMVNPADGKLTWFLDKLAASKLGSCAQSSE